MLLASSNDIGYKIVLLLHILAVVVAIAPAIVHPLLYALEKKRSDGDVVALSNRLSAASRIYAIALIVAGVIGFGLISMSDKVIGFGDAWISASILAWVALNGVLHGMMFPAEKALGAGDQSALKKVETASYILGALFVVLLYLMVVKPGG